MRQSSRFHRCGERLFAECCPYPAAWIVLAWLVAVAHAGVSQAAAPAEASLTSRLDEPVQAAWSGVSLRELTRRLEDTAGVPIVVDRRLDPDRRLSLVATGEPLAEVIARLAQAADASAVILDAYVRLVPPGLAATVTAAEQLRGRELRALDAATRKIAVASGPWEWRDGAEPRQLLAAAAAEAGIALDGLDGLPHDHFPAAALPPLPLADRLDLMLAHFDRRVAWKPHRGNGQPRFAIVPLEVLPAGGPPPTATDKASRQKPPQPRPDAASQTYSLRVEAPLDELLGTLAGRFGLALELDRDALQQRGIAAGEIVRRTVQDASRDELLDAILEPLGLDWKISGATLHVGADDKAQTARPN